MSNGSLSMSKDDLEQAYLTHDPSLAGHQGAEAVVVGPEGITVLATANPAGESEHTWLLRLTLDGVVTWERHYDPKYGAARAITRRTQGGFVIAGEVQRSATAYQASLFQVDAAGEILGAAFFGPRGVTGFNSVQVRADGAILAGGSSAWKGWLVTTDPALHGPAERVLAVDEIKAIRLLPSGDLAALGTTETSTTGFGRAQLASFAPSGQARWQHVLPTSGRGDPAALVVDQDGMLAVGSGTVDQRAPVHVWLAHCDATGTVTWERALSANSANARAWAAVGLPGGYAIAGEMATAEGERMPHVWRIRADGALLWDQRYKASDDGQAFEILSGLDATSDGGVVLVGSTSSGPGKTNVWVVRLAPDGKVVWQRVYGSAATRPS
ncbi:MAG TPA: hypothetical protein VGD37_17040 [Kofleriaceae bacterium]|jgi:hypothetical protein